LLISPERNGTETYQEKELTLYVDDVKMLPLSTSSIESLPESPGFYAFYDAKSERICVKNLPEKTRKIRVYDLMGRVLQEVFVSGNYAMIEAGNNSTPVFIIQVLTENGTAKSVKVMR
jgi:hypothetical protein